MDSNNKHSTDEHSMDEQIESKDMENIKNYERGQILYYSITQVASLLDEEDSNIRYYTNVFDNILKIEILDKEFRYTAADIDKLEFLINLKNKGMTIKEIQRYCESLPLNSNKLINIPKSDETSIEKNQKNGMNSFKEDLINEMKEYNESSIENIIKVIEETQINQMKVFKEEFFYETKEYIDDKFASIEDTIKIIEETQRNQMKEFKENLLNEIKEYTDNKFENIKQNEFSVEDTIKIIEETQENQIKDLKESLLSEIKSFEKVIEQAYFIQQDMERSKKNTSLVGRIFGL